MSWYKFLKFMLEMAMLKNGNAECNYEITCGKNNLSLINVNNYYKEVTLSKETYDQRTLSEQEVANNLFNEVDSTAPSPMEIPFAPEDAEDVVTSESEETKDEE